MRLDFTRTERATVRALCVVIFMIRKRVKGVVQTVGWNDTLDHFGKAMCVGEIVVLGKDVAGGVQWKKGRPTLR